MKDREGARKPAGPRAAFNRDHLGAYLSEIRGSRSLTLQEEQALSIRIQAGDMTALNQLVQANLQFVVAVCRNYQNQGVPLADLISEGNLGLIRAAQRFDGSQNHKFISYAVWWVRQAILAALADQSRALSIGYSRATAIHHVGKVTRTLGQQLGRAPSLQDVAEAMGRSEKEITETLQLASSALSLNMPPAAGGEGELQDTLPDESVDPPDEPALRSLLRKNMGVLLEDLDERERRVLTLYFGLGTDQAEWTLEDIARRMGLTRERVRQIKEAALQRLRHPSRSGRIRPYR